jgi:hypothetical protein
MISHRKVATESPGREKTSDRTDHPQVPMSLQNAYGFDTNDFQPQKLIQLVGCRVLNAPQEKSTAFKFQNGTPRQSQLK